MKNNDKKTALREYLDRKRAWEYWSEKVEELAALDLYRSPGFDTTPSGGGSGNAIEAAVVELELAREELAKAETRKREALGRVIAMIETAPTENQRAVLRHRYIDGMDWEAIAETEGRSKTWATNIHGTALKMISCVKMKK